GLGEASYNILWSYSQVENLVNALDRENYDLALNFTHTKLSAYLLGALQVSEKRGLYHEKGRFQGLSGNNWLRYFNERFSGTQKSLFHYVEILGEAFAVPYQFARENEAASVAPTTAHKNKKKMVLFQCFTSDSKKNWGLQKYSDLKALIEKTLADYEVRILGAPFEREKLEKIFPEKSLLICDLVEARMHLQKAALLVTGDTSIKHLAAQMGTPLVEISIGSSDSLKTGAYSSRAVILKSAVPCAPCGHSQACPHSQHLCADDVTVERVYEAVWDHLSGARVQRFDIQLALEKATWREHLSERSNLMDLVKSYAEVDLKAALPEWDQKTMLLQSWYERVKNALPSREVLEHRAQVQAHEMNMLILCAQEIVRSKKDEAGYFQSFLEGLTARFTHPVQIYDRVKSALDEIENLLKIRENLSSGLRTLSAEGDYYAKGIGHLPIDGFAEAGKSVSRNSQDAEL
ncbi:MAG: glycosyltransferase family 9 protein, partial [Bdellovibrio sp.]